MTHIQFSAMPAEDAAHIWSGGTDAYGLAPEHRISDGQGTPCRHCLKDVAAGEAYLILAYRPFPALQPYAETGPIFLHATPCHRADDAASTPPMLQKRKAHLIKGYSADDRIVYGTGQIVPPASLEEEAARVLERPDVAYVHVRSSVNNCYTCRIDRAEA
ncbi:DUF1203 domain-containing protein [Aestuariivirga litoralis]|uniref:DUF1203 domain-containing protein n=1 Tax=Aestuariivirga litoralis TaxID=2650924 RepID=UPI0018C60735|nr:DUF1203 domain-containing protein [Aestuariivirga litoralis]MBG1231341.1 DUF1203 domain-containing protein [Aestuariivirga litoralis]